MLEWTLLSEFCCQNGLSELFKKVCAVDVLLFGDLWGSVVVVIAVLVVSLVVLVSLVNRGRSEEQAIHDCIK